MTDTKGSGTLLSKDSVCGQTLMNIVSHGNSIIAEIQRLGDHIPVPFFLNPQDSVTLEGYEHIILDYCYQDKRSYYDEIIQKDSYLLEIDEEFKSNYLPIIDRFYVCFSNIYKYYEEITKFFTDLKEGVVFVDQNLEKIFKEHTGKQLLCEMLYLYGVMLLILDQKINGVIRERLLMSYYRYKQVNEIDATEFLGIMKLCERTLLTEEKRTKRFSFFGSKWMPKFSKDQYEQIYPINYFNRFNFSDSVLDLVISKLRRDDIYNLTTYYPYDHHRTTALANQSSILYILLYFKPQMLISRYSDMRSIVDNLFSDNWVISFYIGYTVDLAQEWLKFKAAGAAINNIVKNGGIVKKLVKRYESDVDKHLIELEKVLTEGVITEEYVLDNIEQLLIIIRKCNITLRWLLLHNKYVDVDIKSNENLLLLLLNVAEFEYILKQMFINMLEVKESNWKNTKDDAMKRMKELSVYFSDVENKLNAVKDKQLEEWFSYIEKKINEVNYNDKIKAGNQLNEIIKALNEVEEFKNVYNSLQVKQYLMETRLLLKKCIRYVNIQEEVLFTISVLSDISYGWKIVSNNFIPLMQDKIINNPKLIIKMRSIFLKCASSIIEIPLIRIKDSSLADDLESVSSYYSNQLVKFVRKTLEIIPISMFKILDKVISIHTDTLNQLPTQFKKEDLNILAQLQIRDVLAEHTYRISEFTEGVLAMNKTLYGIVEIDPKQLLENGIRKELVKQISDCLDHYLKFDSHSSSVSSGDSFMEIEKFEKNLHDLQMRLNGMCRSFEYIQDYILVYGLKVWHEEFSRIINYNVEMECNSLLKNKVQDYQSRYQSTIIPIPIYRNKRRKRGNEDEYFANNFMGRLVKELLCQTDPTKYVYLEQNNSWYHVNDILSSNSNIKKENVGAKHFFLIEKAIGISGLRGIDVIISFNTVKLLNEFVNLYTEKIVKKLNEFITFHRNICYPYELLPKDLSKNVYANVFKNSYLVKLFNQFSDIIVRIGRNQLIRKSISYNLNFSCKLHANLLYKSLDSFNSTILSEIKKTGVDANKIEKLNPIITQIENYLEQTGLSNPLERVYITSNPLKNFGFVLGLFIISQISKFMFNKKFKTYTKRSKRDCIDATPFVVGIVTLLKQYHQDETINFLKMLSQYIRSYLDKSLIKIGSSNSDEVIKLHKNVKFVLRFLLKLLKFDINLEKKLVEKFIPNFWFTYLD